MFNVSFPKVANSLAFKGIEVGPFKAGPNTEENFTKEARKLNILFDRFKEKYPGSTKESFVKTSGWNEFFTINSISQEAENLFVKALQAAGFESTVIKTTPCILGDGKDLKAGLDVLR